MKKKLLKSVSLVALSAVMLTGTAFAAAGCGGSTDNSLTIRVSMFCDANDQEFNRSTCQRWAAQYTQELRAQGVLDETQSLSIKFSADQDTDSYFKNLQKQISSNNQPDVFYVSPKYVRTWRTMGRILDISPYLTGDEITGLWEDSVAFYADSSDSNFSRGDRVTYNEATGKVETIDSGIEVGIYGLPKDYSSFGLGYNQILFSDAAKQALTTTKPSQRRGAKGAEYAGAKLTYGAETTPVTLEADGQTEAPLINIGKPTYYKPYNFYKFDSFANAVAGGDPMATMVVKYTGNKGYLVTIPGFPGESFEEAKKWWPDGSNLDVEISESKNSEYYNPNAEYNASQGYITYTYAEYSALTWAVTYYYNTFNWDGSGVGGVTVATGDRRNVYGNDQYDGTLYLLPWLAGNDAQYLNAESTSVFNPGKDGTKKSSDIVTVADADTYNLPKTNMDGSIDQEHPIYYGVNNERFLETLGAFQAYGSDWNGNSNNCGDTEDAKDSGWLMFCAGNQLFYGKGTWDTANMNKTEREFLEFRLMPEPVAERYALASWIKNEDYEMKGYGAAENSSGTNCVLSSATFTAQQIFENQLERQDKWGARMDSVGYGVSATTASKNAAPWRAAAAADLVKYLTVTPEVQVSLTYAGAQLPNYRDQCKDFYRVEGTFAEMITPDDEAVWDEGYELAKKMTAAFLNNKTPIRDWLNANGGTWITEHGYDETYATDEMSTVLDVGIAMKILRMVASYRNDRDISLRMQYGVNATRDSAMYTYNDIWIDQFDARSKNYVAAYSNQKNYPGQMTKILDSMLKAASAASSDLPIDGKSYGTPAWLALHFASASQNELDKAIQEEKDILGRY